MTRRCCGKATYATQNAAQAAARRHEATTAGHPLTTYQCAEGWWHLTSRPRPAWTHAHAPKEAQ